MSKDIEAISGDVMRRLWLRTGAGGQLGRSLGSLLLQKGEKFRSFDHAQLDIRAEEAVRSELAAVVEALRGFKK